MQPSSRNFKTNASAALGDEQLQRALGNVRRGFVVKRAAAREALPEFDALKAQAREIKNHTLANLDIYLEEYERQVLASGGHLHWAADAAEARRIIADICLKAEAKRVTKGKSMVAEEIGLNAALEAAGLEVVETDLGEYIIQLRGEAPSHIIAPAIHLNRGQIEADFRRVHTDLPSERTLDEAAQLVAEARAVLRAKFLAADVGITGANFLVAETGSSVIVTNEGNGDLTQLLPRTHIVLATIEKLVPTLEDASAVMRLLARSATGQEITTYTTFSTGPRRSGDPDGPEAYHVVLLDNGRTEMLGTEFQDMLRCIRCGACLNHCPVYNAIGGHAYGWVYPGPMGAVLTPQLIGMHEAGHLPNASTFCGRCESVCPMEIPLTKMMRHWREREFAAARTGWLARALLQTWGYLAKRPELYHWLMQMPPRLMSMIFGRRGRVRSLPFAGGWTKHRDLPVPQGPTFQALWLRKTLQAEAEARKAAKQQAV